MSTFHSLDTSNYNYTPVPGDKGDKGDKGDQGNQGERGPEGELSEEAIEALNQIAEDAQTAAFNAATSATAAGTSATNASSSATAASGSATTASTGATTATTKAGEAAASATAAAASAAIADKAAGGSANQVQYNVAGVLTGTSLFSFDGTNFLVGTTTASGKLTVRSGSTDIASIGGTNGRAVYFAADSGGVSLQTGAGQTGTGFYFSAASNYLSAYVNSSEKLRVDNAGAVGFGTTALTGHSLRVSKNVTGAPTSYGVMADGVVQSDVTSAAIMFRSWPTTASATFSTQVHHFRAEPTTKGTNSTISEEIGFFARSMVNATNAYGFYGEVTSSGSTRWNTYNPGSAPNYFNGQVFIGATNIGSGSKLSVNGQIGIEVTSGNPAILSFLEAGVYQFTMGKRANGQFVINNGSSFAGTDVLTLTGNGALSVTSTVKTGSYTVATLPSASASGAGARAYVSDATSPTYGATVAGSGSTATPVYSDGTNWKVG